LGLATGPVMGYSIDVARDLTGLKESNRKSYPNIVKRQKSYVKKCLAGLLAAGSILAMAGIYGLTKGQYSPTSEKGKVTKTTPYGSIDYPFNPLSLALGAEATFVSRSLDRNPKHLQEILKRAGKHKGMAFIEIYQNCNIFNDGAFFKLSEKETKDDSVLILEHGKPMVFGKDSAKGIKLDGVRPIVVDITNGKYSKDDLWVHDEFSDSPAHSMILAHLDDNPDFPTPIGVFRQVIKETYDAGIARQIEQVTSKKGKGDLEKMLLGGNTWEVN